MDFPEKSVFCRIGGRGIDPGRGHYVVRIEVFAAVDPPEKLIYLDEEGDFQDKIDKLLEEISDTDPREIEDSVYKFFKFDICRSCQREYLKNPLGRHNIQ